MKKSLLPPKNFKRKFSTTRTNKADPIMAPVTFIVAPQVFVLISSLTLSSLIVIGVARDLIPAAILQGPLFGNIPDTYIAGNEPVDNSPGTFIPPAIDIPIGFVDLIIEGARVLGIYIRTHIHNINPQDLGILYRALSVLSHVIEYAYESLGGYVSYAEDQPALGDEFGILNGAFEDLRGAGNAIRALIRIIEDLVGIPNNLILPFSWFEN